MIFFHRASSVKTLNPRTGMNISNIFNEKTVKFMIPVSKLKKLKISYEKKYKTTENNIENAVDIVKDFFDILYFLILFLFFLVDIYKQLPILVFLL